MERVQKVSSDARNEKALDFVEGFLFEQQANQASVFFLAGALGLATFFSNSKLTLPAWATR